jgi:hypothetical protein
MVCNSRTRGSTSRLYNILVLRCFVRHLKWLWYGLKNTRIGDLLCVRILIFSIFLEQSQSSSNNKQSPQTLPNIYCLYSHSFSDANLYNRTMATNQFNTNHSNYQTIAPSSPHSQTAVPSQSQSDLFSIHLCFNPRNHSGDSHPYPTAHSSSSFDLITIFHDLL